MVENRVGHADSAYVVSYGYALMRFCCNTSMRFYTDMRLSMRINQNTYALMKKIRELLWKRYTGNNAKLLLRSSA